MTGHLRYMRIVFSALFSVACVLLVVLWTRSYRTGDQLRTWLGVVCLSTHGTITASGLHGSSGHRDVWSPRFFRWDHPVTTTMPRIAAVKTKTGFFLRQWPEGGWIVQVPHWFPSLLLAAIGA